MLSVTDVTAFQYCPRQFYLSRVLNLREPPNAAMARGKVVHRCLEIASDGEEAVICAFRSIDDVEAAFLELHRNALRTAILENKAFLKRVECSLEQCRTEAWATVEQAAVGRAVVVKSFAVTHNVWGSDLWNALPKHRPEYRVESTALQLKGVIDEVRIGQTPVPVEFKTGKAPASGVWDGHRVQLAAYMMLLSDRLGMPVQEGIVSYVDAGVERGIVMNPFLRDEVLKLRDGAVALLSSAELPEPCSASKKCFSCSKPVFSEEQIQTALREFVSAREEFNACSQKFVRKI